MVLLPIYACAMWIWFSFSYFFLITTWWVQNMFYRSSFSLICLRLVLCINLFYSTAFLLSLLFFSTPGAALEQDEILLLFFHYITRTFFPNSRDATIIVCPIFSLAIFIFLEERSHLVFRLLYNWKMMRWQMHIYVRGHPKIDRIRRKRRRRRRRRIYRWCCHLQKKKR